MPDQKYIGITPGQFHPQEGSHFDICENGDWDTGSYTYLTHPATPRLLWPKRGDAHPIYPLMRVARNPSFRHTESSLIEITVDYKGLVDATKPHKLSHSVETSLFSVSSASGGSTTHYFVPVPVPTCSRLFVTFTQPTYAAVGGPVTPDFLPAPPTFTLEFTSEEAPTLNYYADTWVLEGREWEEIGIGCWLVTERFRYYYNIAV